MQYNLRKLIRESIESELFCEVRIKIDDVKKRDFTKALGQIYKKALASINPVKILGKIGVESSHSSQDASVFEITLANGDVIKAIRNTNPAFGTVLINGVSEYEILSQELFTNKFPDLIRKYYLIYKTANAGIPSI